MHPNSAFPTKLSPDLEQQLLVQTVREIGFGAVFLTTIAIELEGPVRMLDKAGLIAQLDGLSALQEAVAAQNPMDAR